MKRKEFVIRRTAWRNCKCISLGENSQPQKILQFSLQICGGLIPGALEIPKSVDVQVSFIKQCSICIIIYIHSPVCIPYFKNSI